MFPLNSKGRVLVNFDTSETTIPKNPTVTEASSKTKTKKIGKQIESKNIQKGGRYIYPLIYRSNVISFLFNYDIC